jgi:catechol 2,3-dioxygenase-like lactoylglutathione lyase family enzyme
MLTKFGHITITVKDYDEALDFYTNKLGFELVSDAQPVPGMRWVQVAPRKDNETVIVFEEAKTAEDKARLGKQFTGMTLTIFVDDLDKTTTEMKKNGVEFVEEPSIAPWGKQAVIKDLYGNIFDLVESN